MDLPRVFVGTMYCGEGDFEECLAAITVQKGVAIEHRIISNQPEKEAHDSLWCAFEQAADDCDMLVKIDADTVLAHPEVLIKTYELFQANPRVTSVQAPLYDFFTDGFINGLNSFSPRVRYRTSPELYCDRVDYNHDIQLRANDCPETLRPAGFHCSSANERQAFHYGLHRALKNQNDIRQRVHRAYMHDYNRIRGYALVGFDMAGEFRDHRGFNYQDERFQEAFRKAQEIIDASTSPG